MTHFIKQVCENYERVDSTTTHWCFIHQVWVCLVLRVCPAGTKAEDGETAGEESSEECCLPVNCRRVCRLKYFLNKICTIITPSTMTLIYTALRWSCRLYRSDDHAPSWLDQDQVSAAKQHNFLWPEPALLRCPGLRQEDVSAGGTSLLLERNSPTYPCRDAEESLEVFHVRTISKTLPVRSW